MNADLCDGRRQEVKQTPAGSRRWLGLRSNLRNEEFQHVWTLRELTIVNQYNEELKLDLVVEQLFSEPSRKHLKLAA